MPQGNRPKWVYTFFLLLVTVGWAVFCVLTIKNAVAMPTSASVLEASGTSVLLGALITWNAAVVQYWFRKKSPSAPPPPAT